jgi:hypothetical protein
MSTTALGLRVDVGQFALLAAVRICETAPPW